MLFGDFDLRQQRRVSGRHADAGKTTNDLVMLEAEIEIRGALNDENVMAELAE
jgi:hypothetical protein